MNSNANSLVGCRQTEVGKVGAVLLDVIDRALHGILAFVVNFLDPFGDLCALAVIEGTAFLLELADAFNSDEIAGAAAESCCRIRNLLFAFIRHLSNAWAWLHIGGILTDGVDVDVEILDEAEASLAHFVFRARFHHHVEADDFVIGGEGAIATGQALVEFLRHVLSNFSGAGLVDALEVGHRAFEAEHRVRLSDVATGLLQATNRLRVGLIDVDFGQWCRQTERVDNALQRRQACVLEGGGVGHDSEGNDH